MMKLHISTENLFEAPVDIWSRNILVFSFDIVLSFVFIDVLPKSTEFYKTELFRADSGRRPLWCFKDISLFYHLKILCSFKNKRRMKMKYTMLFLHQWKLGFDMFNKNCSYSYLKPPKLLSLNLSRPFNTAKLLFYFINNLIWFELLRETFPCAICIHQPINNKQKTRLFTVWTTIVTNETYLKIK